MSTDEKRCGSCRHWGDPERHDYRRCKKLEGPLHSDEADRDGLLAFTGDGEDYYSFLCCRREFSCFYWEPKSDE